MLSSYRIGRILGSDVRVHGLFVMMLAVLAGSSFLREDVQAAIWNGLTLVTFASLIVLHEFGHALAARLFGIRTPDITLYPFGGIASLERAPRGPLAEFVIAIAGPMVNLVLAALLFAGGAWHGEGVEAHTLDAYMQTLLLANVGLFLFNLVPAYPMDGGRVLKALIQVVAGERVAVTCSVFLGQLMAVGFLAYAVYDVQPLLGIIGLFLFYQAPVEVGRHPFWMFGARPKGA